jgi:hypothetical protein
MSKCKLSESTIVSLIKKAEAGRKVIDIYREHSTSSAY